MHKNSIMGTRCVYNCTYIMVDMGLDNIVHYDREPWNVMISNEWIEDWESDILRTRYSDNEQRIIHKYKNLRFLDDEDNQTYTIAPESLQFKGATRRNKQYFVVDHTLDWRDGDSVDLLISIYINDNFMVLIKGVEKYHDLGVKLFIHKLIMIARLRIATKRKIIMSIPPRHYMMMKI